MGYFDWHGQPGYFRDITRHFPPDTRLLDVGCGTGWLAEHFPNYTGVDGAAEAVAAATEKGRNVRLGDLTRDLPFENEVFDGVVMKDIIEHLPDPAAAVREVHRVLKPGGLVFASSPDAQRWSWDDYSHLRPYSRKSFRFLFVDHGFTIQKLGYESVVPGTGHVAARTRRKRRPRILQAAAWLPFVRRNVWVLAKK